MPGEVAAVVALRQWRPDHDDDEEEQEEIQTNYGSAYAHACVICGRVVAQELTKSFIMSTRCAMHALLSEVKNRMCMRPKSANSLATSLQRMPLCGRSLARIPDNLGMDGGMSRCS